MTGRNSENYLRRWRAATLAACLILAGTGSRAAAADDEQQVPVQAPVAPPVTSSADFLFGAPRAPHGPHTQDRPEPLDRQRP